MPRSGPPTYLYTLPPIYLAIPGTTITAAQHNDPLDDIADTFNSIQPVVWGGTGAGNAAGARSALDVPGLQTPNTFTANQTIANGAAASALLLQEDPANGSNKVSVIAPASMASDRVLTLPDATDTLVGKATTDTLTNKTLTTPTMTGPIVTTSAIDLQIGQIKFPSGGGASADVNTLDFYGEGASTVTIVGTTIAGVGTYTTQTINWTRIGNRICFEIVLVWTAHTGTGNMQVTGLPYTAAARDFALTVVPSNLTYSNDLGAQVNPSSTVILLGTFSSGTAFVALPIDTAGSLRISGTYAVS